jgi:ornithine carbamoyltransferase
MMDGTSRANFLRALLLVVATAGYQLSSTTPAGKPDNKGVGQNGHSNAHQENGLDSVNSFGEKLADKDVVHDAPNSLLTRMAPSTKSMQVSSLKL